MKDININKIKIIILPFCFHLNKHFRGSSLFALTLYFPLSLTWNSKILHLIKFSYSLRSNQYIYMFFVTRHRRWEWPKNWNPFLLFYFLSQTMSIKLTSLNDHQTSLVLHLISHTETWPLVDYTSPVMSAVSIRYRKTAVTIS